MNVKKAQFFFRMVFYSLLRRRLRMATALLAVAVGATIITGMVTVYREVPRQLGREFRAYGANLLLLPAGEGDTFGEEHLDTVRSLLSGQEIVGIAPFLYERIEINKQPVLAGGTDFGEVIRALPYWQIEGRLPEGGAREILVGRGLAQKFSAHPEELVGRSVTVSAGEGKAMRQYTVTGIVITGGKEEEFAFLPLPDLQKLAQKPGAVSLAQMSVALEGDALSGIEDRIRSGDSAVLPQAVKQIASSEVSVLGKLRALVLIVTAIVLLLTMICVTTTMMAVVTERRREIGLRKALGAANRNIVGEFLGEGCLLGAAGGVLGSVLGYLFAQTVSVQVFGRGIFFSPGIAVLTVALSIIVTGAASMVPVRIATGVDPAIVLRGE